MAKLVKYLGVAVLVLTIMGVMADPHGTAETWQTIGATVAGFADKAGSFFASLGK